MIMKILILGALSEEISSFLKDLSKKRESEWNGFRIYEGKLSGIDTVICQTKEGKVFSAMITQHLLDSYKFDFVLFTGVAGSLKKDLHAGDVLISTELFQHDVDVTALGWKFNHIPSAESIFFKADERLIKIAKTIEIDERKIVTGRIATGDQFIDHTHRVKKENMYNASCADMESAAVAQVCWTNSIPFLVIRIISDNADDGACSDFRKNLPLFAHNSHEVIMHILNNCKEVLE